MSYDSREDTLNHIKNVQSKILRVIQELMFRSINHDASKLLPPEKEVYDKYTPLLQNTEYGSERYKQLLAEMSSGVKHRNCGLTKVSNNKRRLKCKAEMKMAISNN